MASVRERVSKDGRTTWAVLYRQGKKQGSKTFANPDEAERWVKRIDLDGIDKALAWLTDDDKPTGLTVAELSERFLTWKARDVEDRTLRDYRRDFTNWVVPWFGHREAENVTESDVQKWVDHMALTLSAKSVADRHALLFAAYGYGKARSRRFVSHNPCEETDLPKVGRKRAKGTTTGEWRAILAAAETRNLDAHDLILFMGSMGWRWSEAAALAVGDVQDDGVHVWVDVTRVFRVIANRQVLVLDAAKTHAGFRRTRVGSECAAMFRRRVIGRGPNDYVFTNSRGNHWSQNTFLRDTWPKLRAAAGVGDETRRPTPHWLRHMAVANMARAGIPMHEIQRIIGHDDLATTNKVYGGMVATLSPQGVADLDAVLSGQVPDSQHGLVVPGQVVDSLPDPVLGQAQEAGDLSEVRRLLPRPPQ